MTTKNQDIRIIGQGTYGCVYKPEIECKDSMKNKTDTEYISKIQNNNYFSKKEIDIGKMIITIEDHSDYFAPIESSCPINYAKIDNKSLTSCKPYKKNSEGFISCRIRYIGRNSLGKSLGRILSGGRETKQKLDQYFRRFAEMHIYLLNSVSILNKKGILHMDLKENNIMFDIKKKLPIIIDFGLSYKTKKLSIENYIEKAQNQFGVSNSEWYNPWAIEVVLLSNISNMMRQISYSNEVKDQIIEDDKLQILKNSCDEYIKMHNIFKINLFSKDEIEQYRNSLINFIDGFKKKKWIEIWITLTSTYESWDNYSLTVLFVNELNMLNLIDNNNNNNNNNNKKDMFIEPYVKELKTILISSILKRPNAEDTKKELNILFKTINKQKYENTIKDLNNNMNNMNNMNKLRSSLMYETIMEENRIIKQINKRKNIMQQM